MRACRDEGRIKDAPRYVTGKTTEEEDLQIIACAVKGSGRQSVNVWGAITKDGLGPLYRIQDLSPIHTARPVTKHLENLGVMTLNRPPKGTDMNVIENVWGISKHNLSKMGLHTAIPDELWQAIKSELEKLKADSDLVPTLYDSLPRRMSAVVELCGDFTHY
ncbi:hypothetical protein HPB52_001434 [Rhipicephalus sanguineus]|uniref:Tc1-like transposase DDE domain-containing protein n=1 Tax=Rhipicephalus sanguineus TaxID=34632 RepID=A0A9D4PNV9_RHISA|nr:hypothetical protein HPB52_001434 [Rhipicephalus sanguineus]